MKKNLLLLFLCFCVAGSVFSQKRNCGSDEYLKSQLMNDPGMVQRRAAIENFVKSKSGKKTLDLSPDQIVKIPVVIHVVYKTTTENISTAQIQSQINVLNADFRKLNSDVSKTPSAFAGLAADAQIVFELATEDPNGNPTSGITRTKTTRSSFSTDDRVKYSSRGGKDAWPRDKYLNVWVCNLAQILGYAQFPGGPAATDGVVIGHKYFGTTGTATAPFNKGRTATHEVGHWLNLYHIWGDDGTGCSGSDQVSDTPNQADENYGCPSFPAISCSNSPNGDMFMNYMDYTDDACMYMFTEGQKSRMRALFAPGGARSSFVDRASDGGGTVTYCSSKGNSTADEWIDRVTIGSIDNLSGNNGGYGNFTSISTTLAKGSAYTITITPRWSGAVYSEAYNVWIDYNKDGDFTDSGEQVYYRTRTTSSSISGAFTVPSSAVTGATRMRVTMKYNANATSCETFTYGEVEDYTINIGSSTKAASDRFSFGPNPSFDFIHVNFNLPNADEHVNLAIYNKVGKKVYQAKIEKAKLSSSHSIDISGLQKGIYYLMIEGNGIKESKKLVISR